MTNIKDFLNENKGVFVIAIFTAVVVSAVAANPTPVYAGDEPFTGEIMFFAGNFAPRGWALCDGQLLAVSQNDALFSLLGTTYGGDGRTTFGLPDMRGRILIDDGNGPGLIDKRLGAKGGAETIVLNVNQIPAHSHDLTTLQSVVLNSVAAVGDSTDPEGNSLGLNFARKYSTSTPNIQLHENSTSITIADGALDSTGGNQGHSNMPPYLNLNCNIALVGIYPSRS